MITKVAPQKENVSSAPHQCAVQSLPPNDLWKEWDHLVKRNHFKFSDEIIRAIQTWSSGIGGQIQSKQLLCLTKLRIKK